MVKIFTLPANEGDFIWICYGENEVYSHILIDGGTKDCGEEYASIIKIIDERKEKNPCSLCAKMRKGALNDMAEQLGCNKIALGHNKDDVVETFFMSLLYEGRLNCFAPVSFLDRKKLYSIRPLMYVPEWECRSFVNKSDIHIVKNPCLADGNTKRQETKELLAELSLRYDNLQEKVFGAIKRSSLKGWNHEE